MITNGLVSQAIMFLWFFRIERERSRIFGCVGCYAAHTPKNSPFILLKTEKPLL